MLLRQRLLILGLPLLASIAGYALTRFQRADFTAESKFVSQGGQPSSSPLAGLAAQFGVSVTESSSGESPDFYVALLKSRDLLRGAADWHYRFAVGSTRADTLEGTIADLYELIGETPDARLASATGLLGRQVFARTDVRTGMVILETTARWPGLALELNNRLLQLVNEFNLQKRQSQAVMEREFIDGRMGEAQRELQQEESRLLRFLQENRQYQGSPQLTFESARLQRLVDLRQDVYTSLAQAYEQARIDEVRTTPVITVVDPPQGSIRSSASNPRYAGFLGLLLGAVVAVALAFGREFFARVPQENVEEYETFKKLSFAALNDLNPKRILNRLRAIRIAASEGESPSSRLRSGEGGGDG